MAEIWSRDYWADKNGVRLFMFRKRLGAPAPGEPSRPVLFLVHGSSFGTQAGFDLAVAGQDYSMMNWFARRGFDVWGLDHEGYSRSDRTAGNSDIASGVEDLRAGMPIVERETGLTRYMFYGQSSGALRAAAFAQACPERVERVVLDAFVWTGKDAPTLVKRRENLAYFQTHSRRPVDRAFFSTATNPASRTLRCPTRWPTRSWRSGTRCPRGRTSTCAHISLWSIRGSSSAPS